MRLKIIYIVVCLLFPLALNAQQDSINTSLVLVHIENGDTIPYVKLPEFDYIESIYLRSKKQQRKWNKLMANVVKVYPYAQITGELLAYYDEELEKIEDENERKTFMEESEAVLKAEFKGEIMNLTVSQGKVLVKLIDRETGQTSYELIKQLRSGFTAFMWNSIAVLFGNSLKAEYDPIEDADIEQIVQMIERGEIVVAWRDASTAKARADLDKKKKRELRKQMRRERKNLKKNI
jgi:hypothetical protein